MARVAGVDIPDNKRVEIALRRIHGIGPTAATRIASQAGISGNPKVHEIPDDQMSPHQGDHRPRLHGGRRPSPRGERQHPPADRHRHVPGTAASPRTAGARPADEDERTHEAQWPQDGRGQAPRDEEVGRAEGLFWPGPTEPEHGAGSANSFLAARCSSRRRSTTPSFRSRTRRATSLPGVQAAGLVSRERGRARRSPLSVFLKPPRARRWSSDCDR